MCLIKMKKKILGIRTKIKKVNLTESSEQKESNGFLQQIKEEQNNIDMNLFKNELNYDMPDKMLEYLHSLKTTDDYKQETSLIEESFTDFKRLVENMPKGNEKKKIEYC